MNTLETTAGKAYTKDPDYAALTGRVVRTISTTFYDSKSKAWVKRTCEYIDIGRPDAITPADCDELIDAEEEWGERDTKAAAKKAHDRYMRTVSQRQFEVQLNVVDYLRNHGPSHVKMIAADLEMAKTTLDEHVRRRPNVYCVVGNIGQAVLWGLVGVHDKEAA